MLKHLIFIALLINFCNTAFPKIIWIFETRGFNDSNQKFIELSSKNIQYFAEKDNWEVRKLTPSNMNKYVEQIPQFLDYYKKISEFNYEVHRYSDFLRVLVLQHYGGVWFDIGNILVQRLQWLNRLDENPDLINKYGKQPQFFSFAFNIDESQKIILQNGQVIFPRPPMQSYMLASIPHSQFLTDMAKYYKLSVDDPHSIDILLQQNDIVILPYCSHLSTRQNNYLWDCNHYLALNQCFQLALQNKQNHLDQNRKNNENRKFAVQQFAIWTMSTSVGPFLLNKEIGIHSEQQMIYYLAKIDIQNIKQQFGNLRYFIKLTGHTSNILSFYLKYPQIFNENQLSLKYSQLFCPQFHYFLNNSIANQYLLSRDPQFQKTKKIYNLPKIAFCDIRKGVFIPFVTMIVCFMIFVFAYIQNLFYRRQKSKKLKAQSSDVD